MDLRELYQEVILDHSRNPRNSTFPDPSNRSADGHNPLCGDKLTVKCQIEGDTIVNVGFEGSGCAISQAAASTMTEAVKGQKISDATSLFDTYHSVVMGEGEADPSTLGKLAVFAGVAEFPMRVKCATLAWHTLLAALKGEDSVTTE